MLKGIPTWKLRREVRRLSDQLLSLPATIASLPWRLREPARRAAYQRDFDFLTRLSEGQVPLMGKIAVFLIYQPNGVAPSTLRTCKWLAAEGYSPLIVSNAPLDATARRDIQNESWRLLERPNFGYDFGGYRDAIVLLARLGLLPERLIVMNDSIWLPMAKDLMGRLEEVAEKADIVGLLRDEKVRHDNDGGQPSELFHLESYFYLITKSAFENPAFYNFWQSYQMTDSKANTIKYGEIGFSRRMNEAGLKLDALTHRKLFLKCVEEMDIDFLLKTLRYAAYIDPDLMKAASRLSESRILNTEWRSEVLDHIRRVTNRKRFNASFPFANDQIFGTTFMKKSSEPIFSNMRQSYLRAIADGELAEPPSEVLAEIKATTMLAGTASPS